MQRFLAQMPDSGNSSTTLPGTVEKIIKPAFPGDPERAQISVEGGDHLYREIRIENSITNSPGRHNSQPGPDFSGTEGFLDQFDS